MFMLKMGELGLASRSQRLKGTSQGACNPNLSLSIGPELCSALINNGSVSRDRIKHDTRGSKLELIRICYYEISGFEIPFVSVHILNLGHSFVPHVKKR